MNRGFYPRLAWTGMKQNRRLYLPYLLTCTGVTAVFSINRVAVPFSEAKHRSKRDYAETMEDIARFAKALVK